MRAINRLMCVGEAMRFALNSLAVGASDWLLAHSDPEWLDRYGHRTRVVPPSTKPRGASSSRLHSSVAMARTCGRISTLPMPLQGSREIPAVEILRRTWVQNYVWVEGQLHWRSNDDLPPGKDFINSPYDQEARYGKKRETRWTGDIRPSD